MKYLSVCSGIEAASVAWHPIGWEPLAFSEIEPFPRAVLAHHYPDVPCHGDFTKLRDMPFIVDADVLVGGTPCQAFSVAGLRNSLSDDRGNLSLEFVRLADAIDNVRRADGREPAVIVWENVPGVLSVSDNAFGCFLSALAGDVTPYVPPRGKWTDAGVVDGPQRKIAWRVLDAQYFGLAQRRRRVFVVASAREGFDPAAVLLEFEGVRRDTAPRREKGQIAPTIPSRSTAGSGLGTDFDCDGGVIQSAARMVAFGEYSDDGTASTLKSRDYKDATDLVTHSLRAEGFDASTQFGDIAGSLTARHDSSPCADRGMNVVAQPVPVAFHPTQEPISSTDGSTHALGCGSKGGQASVAVAVPLQEVGKRTGVSTDNPRAGIGIGADGDPMYTLQAGAQHGVAVEPYTLAIRGRGDSHNLEARQDGLANALLTPNGGRAGIGVGAVAAGMAVRRLTPEECEALQGFPRGYTNIPWRGKPEAPDGPRYKALGNSMAVPCMAWIGRRIAAHLAETTFRQPETSCPKRTVKPRTKENAVTDNDAKTKALPLHSKVGDADEGDCGWLWYDGKWRLGRLAFSDNDADDALYIDLLLEEKAEWYEVEALKHLPWLPIPRPPYEGNEMPCTHAVTIMDRSATLTFSWNMNESDGKRAVQRITAAIDAMLRETDAPVSVG